MFFAKFLPFILFLFTFVSAAPVQENRILSKKDAALANYVLANIDAYIAERDELILAHKRGISEVVKRDYPIVTEILTDINKTGLAPKIIDGLADDPEIQPIITETVEALIRNGTINLTTLFEALDKSGLAETVIKDLINDCNFYTGIYKVALDFISDLADKILGINGQSSSKNKRAEPTTSFVVEKRASRTKRASTSSDNYDENGVVNQLLESLAKSGLASSVVETLITDPTFIKYGVSLIIDLFKNGDLTVGEVIDALKNSGIVDDLFKEFFNSDTLETVIVNALAAASGKCGSATSGLTASTTLTRSPLPSDYSIPSGSSGSSTNKNSCKKRRKRAYN